MFLFKYLTINRRAITMIELIIALCVALLLGLVSYTTLKKLKNSYRRKEAQAELVKLKSNIQKLAVQHNCSTTGVALWLAKGKNTFCPVLNNTNQQTVIDSANKYYQITVDINANNQVVLTATPNPDGPQTKDFRCKTITLTSSIDLSEDILGSTGSIEDDPVCWE